MAYDIKETTEHSLVKSYPSSLISFNEMIKKEDKNLVDKTICCTYVDEKIKVIDLDYIEIELAKSEKRSRNSTMDFTCAINDGKSSEMLLVELRLNYTNKYLYSMKSKKLTDKEKYSTILVGSKPPIHKIRLFIFQSNLKAEARGRISRYMPSLTFAFDVLDLQELISKYIN